MRIASIILCLLIALRARADADCGWGVELVSPTVAEGTPRLVVETNLARRDTPAFTIRAADGSTLDARIVATHAGYDMSMQYVVEPVRPIRPGTYTLVGRGLLEDTALAFTVTRNVTRPPLTWTSEPVVSAQREVQFGCGPAKTIAIEVGTTPATWAFVELTDTTTSKTARGYVAVRDGRIAIGHGMCGGPFALVRGHDYAATVVLGADWGVSPAKSLATEFQPL